MVTNTRLTPKRIIIGLARRVKHLVFLMFFPLLLLIVILIRIISPIYTIRLKVTVSSRLGHFSGEPDYYLNNKLFNPQPARVLDVFGYCAEDVANHQLAKMWRRKMLFIPFLRHIDRVNKMFPGWERHVVPWNDVFGNKNHTFSDNTFLKFTAEEHKYGEKLLKEIIGSRSGPIVCVHNRDSVYLDKLHKYREWDYHDYRDSDIDNYILAMNWLAEQGYIVLRMGALVAKPIAGHHENVIDYASSYRSDFMDIYLI